jgi:uncharacterized coiled-coil protein SlyX
MKGTPKPRITDQQRRRIIEMIDQGVAVETIALQTKVSEPSIYKIKRTLPKADATQIDAITVLEKQVAAAEARITELERTIVEIEMLRDEVKTKNAVIQSLKDLVSRGAK